MDELTLEQAPWCVMLAPQLALGAVEWWQPPQMLLLRAVCKALRGGQSTASFIEDVLARGLGVKFSRGKYNSAQLYGLCRRTSAERLLLASLPDIAARAAGLELSDPMAASAVVVAGGYALHRYLREELHVGVGPGWNPGDLDIFIPYGARYDDSVEAKQQSRAVWEAVLAHVSQLLPLVFGPTQLVRKVQVDYDRYEHDQLNPDDDPSHDEQPCAGDDEQRYAEDMVEAAAASDARAATEHEREEFKEPEFKERELFQEPFEPLAARTYTRGTLLRMANELELHGPQPGCLATLEKHGVLAGSPADVLGRPRPYKIARVSKIMPVVKAGRTHDDDLCFVTENYYERVFQDGNSIRSSVTQVGPRHSHDGPTAAAEAAERQREKRGHDRRSWGIPCEVNLVQYHGEPLEPLALVGGFDIVPPRVAVSVEPGSARHRFTLAPETAEAIAASELRLSQYTWGPCYPRPSAWGMTLEELSVEEEEQYVNRSIYVGPVRTQLFRIAKYEARGFRLTPGRERLLSMVGIEKIPGPGGH